MKMIIIITFRDVMPQITFPVQWGQTHGQFNI